MPNTIAQAFAREVGTEEWRPVTLYGKPYHANKIDLDNMVAVKRLRFPTKEYKVELIDEYSD